MVLGSGPGSYGWLDGEWRRNAISLGFSGVWEEAFQQVMPAGDSYMNGSLVPAGELRVVSTITLFFIGTGLPTNIAAAMRLPNYHTIYFVDDPVSNARYNKQFSLILHEGGFLYGDIKGATAGDTLYIRAAGYRIKIDQR